MPKRRRFSIRHSEPIEQSQQQDDHGRDREEEVDRDANPPVRLHQLEDMDTHDSHDDSGSTNSSSSNSVSRRVRGPTRMQDLWDMPCGEQVIIRVNSQGVPCYKEGGCFSQFLGTISRRREMCPINFSSWKKMSISYKNEMWRQVERVCAFDPRHPATKEWVLRKLNMLWKDWKAVIKAKAMDPTMMMDDIAARVPDSRVDPDQYRQLVQHWYSAEGQKSSEINSVNKAKIQDPHCTGTKSFARIIQDMTESASGKEPSRAEVYIQSRTHRDGTPVTEMAVDIIDQMKRCMSETASSEEGSSACSQWQGDVYSQIKGSERKGIIRCLGMMPPMRIQQAVSATQSSHNYEEIQRELSETKGKLNQVIGQYDTLQGQYDTLQGQLQEMMTLWQTHFGHTLTTPTLDSRNAPDAASAPHPHRHPISENESHPSKSTQQRGDKRR